MKLGTLFSGGGGFDLGAIAAGCTPIFAIEHDPDIAAVYADNIGNHVTVADITNVDPANFPNVDILHASPPCPNFSVAKTKGEETIQDTNLATSICKFIVQIKPELLTLENVRAYEKSKSWNMVFQCLKSLGYGVQWWILNSADYGVPQTRHRMIAIAKRDGIIPQRPQPTHEEKPSGFLALPKWVGWYEAIEDLIETLPVSQFAPWQANRLPTLPNESVFIQASNCNSNGRIFNTKSQPSRTVDTTTIPKAFIVRHQNFNEKTPLSIRMGHDPSFTITATTGSKRSLNSQIKTGVVVKMTPRALARFQSFPDNYKLPKSKTLACRIIGNAVPPLLARRIIESLATKKDPL